ncbi:transcription factor grauzone-like [Culex pipiens pallens]|uniref:transcription factor grauzone-like n=1 Tax=Culex pipiens pallens TaxID=42434 RepID=UPI0019539B96|nr:transcription factor grauzone-like [Culex pipiens pallens]XP_039435344.1 transcription factor grauzone-like [Culex pipiens pallens]
MEKVANSCRLCLQPDVNNPADVTDLATVDSAPLSDKLSSVFNFTLEKIDRLPKLVCGTCCTMVGDFHEFSERVQHNQEYLRMLVDQQEEVKQEAMDGDWDGEEVGTKVAPEIVKIEPELLPEDDSEGDNSEGENRLDESSESDSDFSEGDDDWTPQVTESREEEEPVVRTKRKYTRRAPLKPKKEKKKPGHDPSKDYRNKPKEEIEEEDRLILEYFKFACELCHDPADTFIELRRHFREIHNQKGFHRCCNKKLFKRCHLLEHIQVHLNPNLYGCDLCSKSFSTKEYKELHWMQTHATVDRPFKCDKCPKSFIQKGQLTSHMGRHQLYPCTLCDKVLAGKGSLSAHMVNMHSDEGRMICDTCGREFKTKTCFDKHTKRHMGVVEDTSIECTECHEILHNKATLKKHMIAKHTQTTEQHICNQCGKQAPNKFALESHKRKVHCEEKYCCEFCEKRFKNPTTLKEHRATHTGEILYQCLYCTTTFNSKANFYTHIKKIHPAEWEQEKMAKKTQRKLQRQQPGP